MADGLALSNQAGLGTQPLCSSRVRSSGCSISRSGAWRRAGFALGIARPSLPSLLLPSFVTHLQAPALLGALQKHRQIVPDLSGVQPQRAGR